MNKKELIALIAQENDITKKLAETYITAVLNGIVNGLKENGKIQLVGFGTFEAKEVPERECRNPQNGEVIIAKAHKRITFKPGKDFKDKVNE